MTSGEHSRPEHDIIEWIRGNHVEGGVSASGESLEKCLVGRE